MKRGNNSKDNDLNLAVLENILVGAYDAFVEENVEIRSQAGLTETITREAIGGCCEWCSKLAGTYRYGEEPKEIYQKHDNCTCVVMAKTDKGYTDVWSKKQYQSQKEAREARAERILQEQGIAREEHRQQRIAENDDFDYMSNSFRPNYGEDVTLKRNIGTVEKPSNVELNLKKVSNSKFEIYADQSFTRREKSVRLAEKLSRAVAKEMPEGYEMPRVIVVDFEKMGIGKNAIAAYKRDTGELYINSIFDTEKKIKDYLSKSAGEFASTETLSPYRHELGHRAYWETVEKIAKEKGIAYNVYDRDSAAKQILDAKIIDFVHEQNSRNFFLGKEVSRYAEEGYKEGLYGEIVAECYASRNEKAYSARLLESIEVTQR